MDYQKILEQLISGELKEYTVEPKNAFEFQKALRNFGKRQNINGKAERGGNIVYTGANSDD
ncbi:MULTISPECIES: hypothetical protein [Lactobacillus]|uniref:Uncharacterized protein n=1 Tax=Lactobacillus xujianguonis TaxID=2495899 RepID=A0A437SWK5_9LACO|nr:MULTISPECIES: hypothetical protein [Lactobacillus]RVU71303.1 hypothetical protein EJK17_02340 [Lactobacillus xujianguonis]RVU74006.1 hypothetical protein EJK20_04930 [Lactobacillus xujianguonis]